MFQPTTSMKKALALGIATIVVGAATSSATLTFDLRATAATGSAVINNGKSVGISADAPGTVTLEIWAQASAAAPTADPYGIQSIIGSIISSSSGGGVTGSLSVATPSAPFGDSVPQAGVPAEISGDTLQDLGSASTTSSTNMIKFTKASASGGQLVGAVFFATNTVPFGATNQAIAGNANGREFKMGTVTLSITSFTSGSSSLNWVIPGFTSPAPKGTRAQWTDGDNIVNNGNANSAEMVVGSAVTFIAAVPEPSAFGMVLIGALGLVGFRRLGFRRS
jgi:hypothetical protein